LCKLEQPVIGKEKNPTDIIHFYGTDFNPDKLKFQRDMFLDQWFPIGGLRTPRGPGIDVRGYTVV
jgi:hypothetical protein